MKVVVLGGIFAILLIAGCASSIKRTPHKTDTFNFVVLNSSNGQEIHNETVKFAQVEDGGAQVKLVHEFGNFFGGGLQFTFMFYSNNEYEAYISPVPTGEIIASKRLSSGKIELSTEWNKANYKFKIEPL
jgi:uncharacterized protein YxeA